ncbi:MAG: hypothetical protein LBK73_11610 [Treponema sp.]|jgi:hypothetical protein|nr:hypothetical protein [Treponema sp.]
MKKKNWLMGTAAVLVTLLFAMGCPQAEEENPAPAGDGLVSSISVAGVNINPLPTAAASIAEATACPVVVNVERAPTEKEQPGVYYKPIQPVAVTLANANETAFFEVTKPGDENPVVIDLPGTPSAANAALITREIGITLPNSNNFHEGQTVWIRVVAADESKTSYYRINVVSQTHDTAINTISINGNNVLDTDQSDHIGPWLLGSSWAQATAGLINLTATEASSVSVAQTLRNNQFDLAKPKVEYAKILAASTGEPDSWSTTAPASFANHDVLAVKVTASNGTTAGYLKVTVNVGGSPFLSSLSVNDTTITLGAPSAVLGSADNFAGIAVQTPAYRVEESESLTASPVVWAVTPVADDPNAAVSWALVAKGASPQESDFTSPTSFDASHNYLYIKVVSVSGEFTMYYLVVYDERPKDTEHVRAASKSVPVYKFTIPEGKTWADMGEYPKVRMRVLQEEEQFNRLPDGYQRNFIFGELSKFPEWDATNGPANFTVGVGGIGGASWAVLMPLIINKQLKAWAVDGSTPAPGIWYTVQYPLTYPEGTKQPWDSNTDLTAMQGYEKDKYWPDSTTTGDVYFGIGITHDEVKEYWIKELSLVSEDGTVEIPCDLLGDGRIDSNNRNTGFVSPENQDTASQLLREMVADPTLQ